MSIESVIGIVAGIFGIITGIAWVHGELSKRTKTNKANLLKQIVDKKLTDLQRRKLLQKLNKNKIVGGRITESYINNFELNGKGIERLCLDLCVQNQIVPTEDLCKELLDTRGQSIRKQYEDMQSQIVIEETPESMEQKNMNKKSQNPQIVYFSEHLTAYKCWENIKQSLEENGISYGLLPNTKDLWARDYMPVYSNGHYVSYVYNPDYLQNDKQYITDNIDDVFDFANDSIVSTKLIIDGGNVILCGDKVIMTDKVLKENSELTKEEIIKEIERAFSAKLVLIPWDTYEEYGHADGMVRFVSDGHILLNQYKDIDPELRQKLLDALSPYFSKISELEYGKVSSTNSWAHINYLQVGKYIFVPQLGIMTDKLAVEQISRIFPDSKVIPVEVKGIVKNGGALNCVSWNYYKK